MDKWYNPNKQAYLKGEYYLCNATPETKEEYSIEKDLINCDTCGLRDCGYRNSEDRFPIDAGGKGQCIRLEEYKSDYAFRNDNGLIIVIPDEVIERIVERAIMELTKRGSNDKI